MKTKPIYTLDIETDPFQNNRYPLPFSIGLYDGERFVYYWGNDCIYKMRDYIERLPSGIIYLHNGGRFDIYYLMEWVLGNPMKIINGRITRSQMMMDGKKKHELRDSYAIMPVALGSVEDKDGKLDIDYWKLEYGVRELHRTEILEYLERDVILLWRLCTDFVEMFGVQLTIGGTAMKQLKKWHNFETLSLEEDAPIRQDYFYGGRVECFEKGIIEGSFKVYDVNSMYPSVMQSIRHPAGKPMGVSNRIGKFTHFVTCTGTNYGAFPMRQKGGGLKFDVEYGTYHVTRHEFDMAEELGLFVCDRIDSCLDFDRSTTFDEFISYFYAQRLKADEDGDEIRKLFYKLVMNSAYGKFAQCSENYCESMLTDAGTKLPAPWRAKNIMDMSHDAESSYIIWERALSDEREYDPVMGYRMQAREDLMYNVATGCSITGAARSVLMKAIAQSKRPIYCDTDSLICEDLPGAKVSKDLGAWKLECQATMLAIAGKKLYAVFSEDDRGVRRCIKQANKGVVINAGEIYSVCQGETVKSKRESPSFNLDGSYKFIEREVRMTV